jgi:hypothetical protein
VTAPHPLAFVDAVNSPVDALTPPASPAELLATLLALLGALQRDLLHTESDDFRDATSTSNGTALVELMHELEPTAFTQRAEELTTPMRRLSAVKTGLEHFFQTSLVTHVDLSSINLQAIIDGASSTGASSSIAASSDLFKLLEVILLCAIHSQRKDEVVHAIMVRYAARSSVIEQVCRDLLEIECSFVHLLCSCLCVVSL